MAYRHITILIALISSLSLYQCKVSQPWEADKTILLGSITPIGMATVQDEIWISDGNNNQIVQINSEGQVIGDLIPIERPMHLSTLNDKLYIPSYGIDQILVKGGHEIDTLIIQDSLDAPAAVFVTDTDIAIADFYNHRVLLKHADRWMTIGGQGKSDGEMNYPTDVHIHGDRLYVADAYNNRGQVFTLQGEHIMTFGNEAGINAATGIYVTEKLIYLTDFENNRVLSFDHKGRLKQILTEGLSNPSDMEIVDERLWVLNFSGKYITTYVSE